MCFVNNLQESIQDEKVRIEVSNLHVADGICEYQVMLHATETEELFENQLLSILRFYQKLLTLLPKNTTPVFMRFFLSDSANQSDILYSHLANTIHNAVSVIEQSPLDGSKIALWIYLQSGVETVALPNGLFKVCHGSYQHYWSGSDCCPSGDSAFQTRSLLNRYIEQLTDEGCNLADNCIRTWFFVQNVDVNYAGVVKGRNEIFATQNLTPQTHFIASTGINGRSADYHSYVQLDTYGVKGIVPEQVHYLYGKTHLNPTYEYGVSFERGTSVDYGDRRHVFISGTASINNKGEVMYPGNIKKQTERMLENIEVLLEEANCNFDNVQVLIIYLRDISDYTVVNSIFEERYANIPKVIVKAPVCRPGWLIETECIAMRLQTNSQFANL